MRKRDYRIRTFRCPECGGKMYAAKRATRMTPIGHIKDLYCPYCKAVRKMEQIDE